LNGELDEAVNEYSEAIHLDPKYARAYNNRGLAYQSRQDLRQAISDFSDAIRIAPKMIPAYLNRGSAYMAMMNYQKALLDFDEAVQIDPENPKAYKYRAEAYKAKGNQENMIADLVKAAKCYKPKYSTIAHKVMQMELPLKGKDYVPNYELLDSIIDQAKAKIRLRNSYADQDIIAVFQAIDAVLMGNKFVTNDQGLLCDALVPRSITKDVFQHINPSGFRFRPQVGDTIHVAHPMALCLIYSAIGEALGLPIGAAMTPVHPYVRWNRDDSTHINWETTMGVVKSDKEYALQRRISNNLIQNGVYLAPLTWDEMLAYEYASIARVWMGEWPGFENQWRDPVPQAAEMRKGDKASKVAVAEQDAKKVANEKKARMRERSTKAMEALNKAIDLNPKAYEVLAQRATIWAGIGEFDRAIVDASAAIQLDPDQANPYVTRGVAELSRNDQRRALADFEKVIQLNPELPVGYYFRGVVEAENRQFDKSVEDLSKAIRIEPNFIKAYEIRTKVYEQLGQKDKMSEDIETLKSFQRQQSMTGAQPR
jgi:tetratricopeptide (TPR) repeat protein